LPLLADGVKPLASPTAEKFTFTVPGLKMSGAAAFVLPETIELTIVMTPVLPCDWAMPPPPGEPPAVLLVIVLFWIRTVPLSPVAAGPRSPTPPPLNPALLPEMVLLRMVKPPVPTEP